MLHDFSPWRSPPVPTSPSRGITVTASNNGSGLGMKMKGMILESVEGGYAQRVLGQCVGMRLVDVDGLSVSTQPEAMLAVKGKPIMRLTFVDEYGGEISIPKGVHGDIGGVFEGTILKGVIPASTASEHGLSNYIGRRVTHVNGIAVHSLDSICQAASGGTSHVVMRFEPVGTLGIDSSPLLPPHVDMLTQPLISPSAVHELRSPRMVSSPHHFPAVPSPPPPPPPPPPPVYPPVSPQGQGQGQGRAANSQSAAYELEIKKDTPGEPLGCYFHGMVVENVMPGSPSHKAGAERFIGMKLTHINNQPVSSTEAIQATTADSRMIKARFQEPLYEADEVTIHRHQPDEPLGLNLQQGVLVEVGHNSPAARAGAEAFIGRHLTAVNGMRYTSLEHIASIQSLSIHLRFEENMPQHYYPIGSQVQTIHDVPAGAAGIVRGKTFQDGEHLAIIDFPSPIGQTTIPYSNLMDAQEPHPVIQNSFHNQPPQYQSPVALLRSTSPVIYPSSDSVFDTPVSPIGGFSSPLPISPRSPLQPQHHPSYYQGYL